MRGVSRLLLAAGVVTATLVGCRGCERAGGVSGWDFREPDLERVPRRDSGEDTGDYIDASPGDTADPPDLVSRDVDEPHRDVKPRDVRDVATTDGSGDTDDATRPPADCVLTHPYTGHEPVLAGEWTADDHLRVWLDGELLGTSEFWRNVGEDEEELEPGRHVVAVRAEDRAQVISGFIARFGTRETSPECMRTGTSESGWRVTATHPDEGWRQAGYDDSGWATPRQADRSCRETWGDRVDLEGAEWVWHADCSVGDEGWHERNWYRLEFEFRLE